MKSSASPPALKLLLPLDRLAPPPSAEGKTKYTNSPVVNSPVDSPVEELGVGDSAEFFGCFFRIRILQMHNKSLRQFVVKSPPVPSVGRLLVWRWNILSKNARRDSHQERHGNKCSSGDG